MKISQKMQDAINEHVAAEVYSAFLYLAMSAAFEDMDMPGAAHWMRLQYKEELAHAEKFFDYVVERDGSPKVLAMEEPPAKWESALQIFQQAYEHEQQVSARIGELVDTAREERDHATEVFLQWFVSEQVEEEATVKGIVQQLKLVEGSRNGFFMIDRELAGRQLAAPPAQ